MKKSQLSAVMRELNARRNKKYGKEWRVELAEKASEARWKKHRKEKEAALKATEMFDK